VAYLSAIVAAVIEEMPLLLLLLVIGVSGARRVWVLGRELARIEQLLTDERVDQMGRMNELRVERDQWRKIALMQSGRPLPEGGHPHESRLAPDHSAEGD
jgi:hypothetical protein